MTNERAFGPVVYGTLTARDPDNVTKTLWTETGRWVAAEEFERLRALVEKWQRECTGKHGSQNQCVTDEPPAIHPQTNMCLGCRRPVCECICEQLLTEKSTHKHRLDILQPCPFCGHEAAFRETAPVGHDRFTVSVECSNTSCAVRTPQQYARRDKAAAGWNRRAEKSAEPDKYPQ